MLNRIHQEGIELEVRHVKVHRTKEAEKKMTMLVWFLMEGNEKADDLAKEGVMDGRIWYKSEPVQCSKGGERCVRLCRMRVVSTVWWRNGQTVRNSSQSQEKTGVC